MSDEQRPQQIKSKSLFGRDSCLVVQQTESQEVFLRVGKKLLHGWTWETAKLKPVEGGEIVALLRYHTAACRFYHTYKEREHNIFVNRVADKVFVRVGEMSKPLLLGEQELLRVVLETFLGSCFDLVLSCAKGERRC